MTAGRFRGSVVSLSSFEFLRGTVGSSGMSFEGLMRLLGVVGLGTSRIIGSGELQPFWSIQELVAEEGGNVVVGRASTEWVVEGTGGSSGRRPASTGARRQ